MCSKTHFEKHCYLLLAFFMVSVGEMITPTLKSLQAKMTSVMLHIIERSPLSPACACSGIDQMCSRRKCESTEPI